MSALGQIQIQKRYDNLYGDVKKFFFDSLAGHITAASVATLTRYAMEVVQTKKDWQGMQGYEKKDLVYGVITALVTDLLNDKQVVGENFDSGTRDVILSALPFVPMIIDAAADYAKVYAANASSTSNAKKFCCWC